jgi:hypothetical protein
MTKLDYSGSYGSSTYDEDGYEREVHCHECGAVIYITDARMGNCNGCQEDDSYDEFY